VCPLCLLFLYLSVPSSFHSFIPFYWGLITECYYPFLPLSVSLSPILSFSVSLSLSISLPPSLSLYIYFTPSLSMLCLSCHPHLVPTLPPPPLFLCLPPSLNLSPSLPPSLLFFPSACAGVWSA